MHGQRPGLIVERQHLAMTIQNAAPFGIDRFEFYNWRPSNFAKALPAAYFQLNRTSHYHAQRERIDRQQPPQPMTRPRTDGQLAAIWRKLLPLEFGY
jgi:hypothetical protein